MHEFCATLAQWVHSNFCSIAVASNWMIHTDAHWSVQAHQHGLKNPQQRTAILFSLIFYIFAQLPPLSVWEEGCFFLLCTGAGNSVVFEYQHVLAKNKKTKQNKWQTWICVMSVLTWLFSFEHTVSFNQWTTKLLSPLHILHTFLLVIWILH